MLKKLRERYIKSIVTTRERFENFRHWSKVAKAKREVYLASPTRANKLAYVHAKRMRAIRLRTFRKSKIERANLKAKYQAEKRALNRPLRLKAYDEALKLVGLAETGGNNRGDRLDEVIREGGGIPGQAWCGWAMAYCYKRAGSVLVTWQWGAVRLMAKVAGIIATVNPLCGHLVRFTFDHVGMFVHWCDENGNRVPRRKATHIKTLEGNTGDTGAVSDSKTGGDGFKVKIRHRSLLRDFLAVPR